MKRYLIIILLFTIIFMVVTSSSSILLAANKPFFSSVILSSDPLGRNPTNIFSSSMTTVYWIGYVEKVNIWDSSKCVAKWISPSGKLVHTEEFTFDFNTKSAKISYNLGDNPWVRVETGQWELNIFRKNNIVDKQIFTVEPAIPPEELSDLYKIYQPTYINFWIDYTAQIISENAILTHTELLKFKDDIYIHVSLNYLYSFNDLRTTPASRASTVIMGPIIKAMRSAYQAFGSIPELNGIIIDISYLHYNFVSKSDKKHETTKIVITNSVIKNYIELSITLQELLKQSIVLINDERIDLSLQPIN